MATDLFANVINWDVVEDHLDEIAAVLLKEDKP